MIQLINAAKTAVVSSQQHKGGKNMTASNAHKNLLMFRDAWQETASLLSDAIDNTTSIHHFLAVSGELHARDGLCTIYHDIEVSQ